MPANTQILVGEVIRAELEKLMESTLRNCTINHDGREHQEEVRKRKVAPEGEPREGVTILGGEPLLQPKGLLALNMIAQATRATHHAVYWLHAR